MRFLKKSLSEKFRLFNQTFFAEGGIMEVQCIENLPSAYLERTVKLEVFLPPKHYSSFSGDFPLLIFNDGQDLNAINLISTLEEFYTAKRIPEIIVIGLHANDRMQEYGTAGRPDYKKRGSKANAYTQFVLSELLPFLRKRYRITNNPEEMAFAGFSLGGLSAFDIVWNNPEVFKKVGVFSGSLWWRSKAFREEAPDANRIVHQMVEQSKKPASLKFWLQTGTLDETEDRNNNGVIDSIDDTLDLIKELKSLGFAEGRDIKYLEVIGGEHNTATWAKVLPDFLRWAFGSR